MIATTAPITIIRLKPENICSTVYTLQHKGYEVSYRLVMINSMNNTNKHHQNNLVAYSVVANQINDFENKWRGWHYKNTTLLLLSLVVFIYLAKTPTVD